MITGINESKTLTKHIPCEYKCKFNGRKCNPDQWWNNDKCQCKFKKRHVCEKDYVWNPATSNCENGKYLASITNDSVIIYDKIIESYEEKKAIRTIFNEKKATCKTQNFYIAHLSITIALLIAVSIYCYLIKYQAMEKDLLPFHFTNNKFKIQIKNE